MSVYSQRPTDRRVLSPPPPAVDRYRVGSLLGQGESGTVHRAIDTLTGETVALKRLAPGLRADAGIAARFAALSAGAARIDSPHVVHVRGIERDPEGAPFLVLELVEGTDLAHVIQSDAPLPATRAIHIAVQILDALRAAHAVGVVHRRLGPSDCLVVEEGGDRDFVKVINFGAGELSSERDALSDSSAARAALAYVAPEQVKNVHAADTRSDVYAVGAMLYEMLTRRKPFEAGDRNALVLQICTEPPMPLHDLRADLSPELCGAVEHALVKSPAGRAASAVDLAEALLATPEARSHAVSVRKMVGSIVDPMAATISGAALPIVSETETWAPPPRGVATPAPIIPPNAPERHHLVPHPDPWAALVAGVVLLMVGWAIYAATRPVVTPRPLPTTTIVDEPVAAPPAKPVEPRPIVLPVEPTIAKPTPTVIKPASPKPTPTAKPPTTTIVLPPFLSPTAFPTIMPTASSTKPKIGGAAGP
jgi:serine/threonine protein kinase